MSSTDYNGTWQDRAHAHAKFCRQLAENTPYGPLQEAILQTALICEQYVDQSEDPTWPRPFGGIEA